MPESGGAPAYQRAEFKPRRGAFFSVCHSLSPLERTRLMPGIKNGAAAPFLIINLFAENGTQVK